MAEMQVDSMPGPIKRAISDPAVEKGAAAMRWTDRPSAMGLAVSKGIRLPFAETGKDGEELPGDGGGHGEEERGGAACDVESWCDGPTASRKDEAQTAIL